VLDLISPPSGAPLISGLGDIGGFRHTDLDRIPATMFTSPVFTTTTSLDYAERSPSIMVRAGNFDTANRPDDRRIAFSTDGGANWFQATEPGGVTGGGTVAAAADGSRFVWSPQGTGVHYTVGLGNTWQPSAGIPAGAVVESDRVAVGQFYGYANGAFSISTDGGATFTQTGASGLPTQGVKFKAVPGVEGEIWLAGAGGLWRSTDAGTSFARVAGVESSVNVAFGAAAPGRDSMAVYSVATIDGVTGVFRSDDVGGSWLRINDDQHQYGNMGEALTGDPRVHGRVYLGTNGRGILVGEPAP
jgi:xyloglucan-specific exo-beta-1,4-glucanase